MLRLWKERLNNKITSGMLGPGADEAFTPLAAPEIRQRVLIAHLTEQYRHAFQRKIGLPLGRALLRRWMQEQAGSRHIEAFGLPRHLVDEALGDNGLTLHVDPSKLIRIAVHAPRDVEGLLLNTPEKIHRYLRYIDFLDGMATNGFDPSRGKDPLAVAISREGRILKINRGLHRLAMAQRVGLPSVPVRVYHVHRLWWNRVTQGTTGEAALKKVRLALRHCVPEQSPGPLDDTSAQVLSDDF